MLSRLSISMKFGLLGFLGCAILGLVLGTASVLRSQSAAQDAAESQLAAVAVARGQALSSYLGSIEQDLTAIASNPNTISALAEFQDGFAAFGSSGQRQLQQLYIEGNPHPTGQKENLDFASDGSRYSAAHRQYHPWFREFLRTRGYYDIFLFNTDGDLVYTVFKELDYATNLTRAPYGDTDLGNSFSAAMRLGAGDTRFFDFAPYAPSNGAPASFIATPVFDAEGNRAGVLAFQMPIDGLNELMGSLNGLGETGEAYAIGPDGMMRTDARFSADSTILTGSVDAAFARTIFNDRSGTANTLDHRGENVIAAFAVVEFNGVEWGVVVNSTEHEALAVARNMTIQLSILALVGTCLVGAVGFWIAMQAAKPISNITNATQAIADGELTLTVPHQDLHDEVGALARTVEVFKRSAVEKLELERQHAEAEAKESENRQQERIDLAARFENAVGSIVDSVSLAATDLSQAAESMSANSEETSVQSVAVAAAAEQATANVETVATATEEMSASVQEIGRQATESATKADNAEREATETVDKVTALSDAAARIGDFVSMIQGIAEQTNLLALNATIEAARAGEAGKGFAIVAQEVKQLASQTAGATTDISDQIQAIQGATDMSATAITSVSSTIAELNEIATSIAAAVEEQAAATQEIADNVVEAATGTREVSSSITGVNDAATASSSSATQVLASAQDLSRQADAMRSEINIFLDGIRAA
jgi:methyl-accepting chemotaxis protein